MGEPVSAQFILYIIWEQLFEQLDSRGFCSKIFLS